MKFRFIILLLLVSGMANAQLLSWTPDFIKETDGSVTITMDPTYGNKGLLNYASPDAVFVHTGVITNKSSSSSDWKYTKFTWGSSDVNAKTTYNNVTNKFTYTLPSNLRSFYNISDPAEVILKISILFRNASGSVVQRNADGSDMYIPVYATGLNVRVKVPPVQPLYYPRPESIVKNVGDQVAITAVSAQAADLKLYLNGTQVGTTVSGGTTISANPTITVAGSQVIVAEASAGGNTKRDTVTFFIRPANVTAELPAGVKDGINYDANNPAKVTLVLYAPNKSSARIIGDFTNWTDDINYQMYKTPDGLRYWRTITVTPGVEYGYQYTIDDTLRVADIYSEKILDPWNDKYITANTYPGLKAYPEGQASGIVSVLQTAKPAYSWQVTNFKKPNKSNLVVYELLVRDFVASQLFKSVKDSIPYLKKLGITALELMPVNEFEGNNSWGYNPDYYFAVDKAYGTETDFKDLVDECHKNGIAVIMDIALNHAFGLSPTVQMYFNSATGKPAANNPWHNVDATHPFNVGYDFNHEAPATKYLVSRVVQHWLTNYKIDGFRWDLSKGFTQTNSGTDVNLWSAYDQSRINIWKRIYDTMQSVSPNSYCILEHFAANDEEIALSNYGMMLWGNGNHDFNEATMGYVGTSNFQYSIFTNRGWSKPNLVSYMESHDEERLMYKNEQFGNSAGGAPPYSTKSVSTALKRMAEAAAFWAMTPAPKMLWQFGELGYDSTINLCENGTISTDCRTSPKPIKWSYLTVANRKALYDTYSKLFTLRKVPNFESTFTSSSIGYNLGGAFKWLQVTTDSLKICVIGNFDVVTQTGSVTFQNAGAWYPYVKGGTQFDANPSITATGGSQSFTLAAGEYYVFLNRDVSALLPAVYTFTGNGNWNVAANWAGGLIPPAVLPNGGEIIINPIAGGSSVLNVPLTVNQGGKLTVVAGKNLIVQGNLQLK
jgi:hypothetical protein